MAVETRKIQHPAATTEVKRRLFTVEEYDRMGEVGIFMEDDRIELIEGEIVEMAAKSAPHILCRIRCIRLVTPHVSGNLWLAVQDPVCLGGRSKPEPDLLVCRTAEGAEPVAPNATNTLLVGEVSDSSLAKDRNIKLPLYGRHGIPEAWLFDVINKRMERHTEPGTGGYRQIAIARRGESLTSTVLPGLTIAVDDVLR